MFSFPPENDGTHVLNVCILHAKYYIYFQCLLNRIIVMLIKDIFE